MATINGNQPPVKILLEKGIVGLEGARRLTDAIEDGFADCHPNFRHIVTGPHEGASGQVWVFNA